MNYPEKANPKRSKVGLYLGAEKRWERERSASESGVLFGSDGNALHEIMGDS